MLIYKVMPLKNLSLKITFEQAEKVLKGQDWVLRERQKSLVKFPSEYIISIIIIYIYNIICIYNNIV